MKHKIYLATVGLERNRWSSRVPSIRVSDWLGRIVDDGFDGVELWANHYLLSDADEQKRLESKADAIAVYNSYVGFDDASADARKREADAVTALKAQSVKYNVGHNPEGLAEFKNNLLEWSRLLPEETRLICECHEGSVVDRVETCAAFFQDVDPDKFPLLVHISPAASQVKAWFDAFGDRIAELHIQMRAADSDPRREEVQADLDPIVALVNSYGFPLNVVLEFTRGIKREEDTEEIYDNFLVDLAYFKDRFVL